MSNQELLLRRRVNPLLVLSDIMRGISEKTYRFLNESWAVFNDYITYKFLKKNESKVKNAVLRAEELAQTFVKVIQEIPTDSVLEASVLLYFILANEGISKRYEDVLVKPSLNFISRCIDDYSRGIVSLDSSPALSRCIGLSYIFADKLSEEYKEVLKELAGLCDRLEPPYGYFCLYVILSNTLKAILNREKDELLCRHVANVSKVLSGIGILETITLMFLTIGLSQYAGCRNEAISLRLFQKLAEVLEKDRRTLIRKSRKTWIALSLALKLNKLEKLTYVPEGYVVLRENTARRIANILVARNKRVGNLLSLVFTALSIALTVILTLITQIREFHPVNMSLSLIILLSMGCLMRIIYNEYREIQGLLIEPDTKKLLVEIEQETR